MAPEVPINAKSREQLRGEVDQMKNLNLAADAVLIACPKCQAWPMAANIVKLSWASRPTMQFTCAKCHFTSDQKTGPTLSGSKALPDIDRR
jgi:transposase-like protein